MRLLILVAALLATLPAYGYDYPINDPWLATVVGTPPPLRAALPDDIRLKRRRLPKTNDWVLPEAMWYAHRLQYSFKLQRGPAPMMFFIAGTGGYHDTGKNLVMLKAFYQAGYHVVGISSPTHTEFVIAASTTGVPGNQETDAKDLYRVIQDIRADIGHSDRITGYHLAGYSLGATNSAFVAKLDAEQKKIGFGKVLMINPSVSLYHSVSMLDRMLQNIPGGLDNFGLLFDDVVNKITGAYGQSSSVEFTPDLVFAAFKDQPPTNEELAALIGIAFRFSSSALIFASDLRTNFGFVKPSNVTFTRNSSLQTYGQVSFRVGFTDYYHEYFWPFYEKMYPDESRFSFAQRQTLQFIGDFLASAENIAVMTNQDDIILEPGEIEFLTELFGDRATIFPNGGHLGNFEDRDFIAHMLEYFK